MEILVEIIVLHEYSLFYGGSNAVETQTPVDIFKRKTKARLLERMTRTSGIRDLQ